MSQGIDSHLTDELRSIHTIDFHTHTEGDYSNYLGKMLPFWTTSTFPKQQFNMFLKQQQQTHVLGKLIPAESPITLSGFGFGYKTNRKLQASSTTIHKIHLDKSSK